MKPQNIILLSTKSSGSTAIQQYVTTNFNAKTIENTPHHENETLFWTKASSAVGLSQEKLHRSIVPYSLSAGRDQLNSLLKINGIEFVFKDWSKKEIFQAYYELIKKNKPIFFEKSPHHLRNFNNLELIFDCKEYLKEKVDFIIICLIRNPMDTIYSVWKRWHYDCSAFEDEWFNSYQNLKKLCNKMPESISIFQYEKLINNSTPLNDLLNQYGILRTNQNQNFHLHRRSIQKWKKNSIFSHQLSSKTIELAKSFGYEEKDLMPNRYSLQWPLVSNYYKLRYSVKQFFIKNNN